MLKHFNKSSVSCMLLEVFTPIFANPLFDHVLLQSQLTLINSINPWNRLLKSTKGGKEPIFMNERTMMHGHVYFNF